MPLRTGEAMLGVKLEILAGASLTPTDREVSMAPFIFIVRVAVVVPEANF